MMAKVSAEWGLGLLAGTFLGVALAMIFVEPYWITPESKARTYVALAGVAGASAVTVIRNRVARRAKPPAEQPSA
jgi:hypothetical protein